jgi:type II secretory pathway pseudopilin PulG
MINLKSTNGDTIVEVLIALAVLATVIVGAYASANRSQNSSQASQERAEAVKIAETQIEQLKGLLASSTPPSLLSPSCFKDDNGVETITSTNPFSESLENATLPYTGSSGGCEKGGRYNVAIQNPSSSNYEFLVRWERIGGGRDQINMYYRAH